MVKFYTQNYTYDYPFQAVSLAFFLRYPNPYSKHVISTDVLERHFDPKTQRLTTTRLLLKKSRMPSAVLRLLPRNLLGTAAGSGDSQSYILERSVVDIKEGWMRTESRNLELRTVLDVIERHTYLRGTASPASTAFSPEDGPIPATSEQTDVRTVVTLHSRLGQRLRNKSDEKMGFLRSWSQASLQRSIEAIGLSRAHKSQPNATEGMKVVLERLRSGGLVAVFEGMRNDRETAGHLSFMGRNQDGKR
jgi:4-amino-4-deoxychorismate lyase